WPVDFRCSRLRRIAHELLAPIEDRRPRIDDGPNVFDERGHVREADPPRDPDGGGSKVSGRNLLANDSRDHNERQRRDRKKSRHETRPSVRDGIAELPPTEIEL